MRASETAARRIVVVDDGRSVISETIAWLRRHYSAEIVSVVMDVGQPLDPGRRRDEAVESGAVRAHVLDLREEVATDTVLSALKADALHADGGPFVTGLERPVIARQLVAIAHLEHAVAVAQASGGSERGEPSIAVLLAALDPALHLIRPAPSGDASHDRHRRRHPLPATIWGRIVDVSDAYESHETPESRYNLTRAAHASPTEPAYVDITFERGVPIAINDVSMALVEMIGSLTAIAGAHGIGRGRRLRETEDGHRWVDVYEAPASVVLHEAHQSLQRAVTSDALAGFSAAVSREYSSVVSNDLWFTPLHEALDAFVNRVQDRVSGTVRLKLLNGECLVVACRSPHAVARDAAPAATETRPSLERLAAGLP
jgi:argininosuccinate synthase